MLFSQSLNQKTNAKAKVMLNDLFISCIPQKILHSSPTAITSKFMTLYNRCRHAGTVSHYRCWSFYHFQTYESAQLIVTEARRGHLVPRKYSTLECTSILKVHSGMHFHSATLECTSILKFHSKLPFILNFHSGMHFHSEIHNS